MVGSQPLCGTFLLRNTEGASFLSQAKDMLA